MSLISSDIGNCQFQKTGGKIRPMAVADSFYPAQKEEVLKQLHQYFDASKTIYEKEEQKQIAAVIAPHAGYIFSGEVAAAAYQQIRPEEEYEHIFLIGPTHHVFLEGASVNNQYDYYATPLGAVKVDTELCNKLIDKSALLNCQPAAHDKEHCLEVQLPFLQYRLKKMPPIVPIIIGAPNYDARQEIAQTLEPYFNERNLFVISSDFSHYPSYEDAKRVDQRTGEAIASGSLKNFISAITQNDNEHIKNLATSACGEYAIALLLQIVSDKQHIKINSLLYRNSGDSKYGEHNQVVGYHAFAFEWTNIDQKDVVSFALNAQEQEALLRIARRSTEDKLMTFSKRPCNSLTLTDQLHTKCGAFVTLYKGKQLRGCIGHFGEDVPLYRLVEEMAQAAAFEDPRFMPLRADELQDIQFEISVLTPLKKIKSIDEFHYGRQGIYMNSQGRSGTFLPQVAQETHWSKEEFLGHCAQDKAGLSWDGWKEADLYTYEAIIFKEHKP